VAQSKATVVAYRLLVAMMLATLGGLCLLSLLHFAAAHKCPERTEHLVSRGGGNKANVLFKNMMEIDLTITWVDSIGEEKGQGYISADSEMPENTYVGHVFRLYSADGNRSLVKEHTVKTTNEVIEVKRCTLNQVEIGGATRGDEEFQQLVHDQKAPCLPANQSSKWSCVRPVSQEEFDSRTSDSFGFATQREAGFRHIGDMTDDGYTSHIPQIPRLTNGTGYLKMNFTKKLRDVLLTFYHEKKKTAMRVHEEIGGGYTNNHVNPFGKIDLDAFPDEHNQIISEMKAVLQWWVRAKLKHTATFGIRVYRRNAILIDHVDRADTHLASAVLQVAQQVDEGWPLEVVRENGERYEVYLQPGEMVLYEGAKLRHGRPMRFRGSEFANVFSHFAPFDWHGPGNSPKFKAGAFLARSDMEL